MATSIERDIHIENPRNHPAKTVNALRTLLARGIEVTPDPKRANFYEVEDDSVVYYIHVFPSSGKVLLLATWDCDQPAARLRKSA